MSLDFRRKSDWINAIANVIIIVLQAWLAGQAVRNGELIQDVKSDVTVNSSVDGCR